MANNNCVITIEIKLKDLKDFPALFTELRNNLTSKNNSGLLIKDSGNTVKWETVDVYDDIQEEL